jgi:hypothetical protein
VVYAGDIRFSFTSAVPLQSNSSSSIDEASARLLKNSFSHGALIYGSNPSHVYLGDNYVANLSASRNFVSLQLVSRINGSSSNIQIASFSNANNCLAGGGIARLSDGRIAVLYGIEYIRGAVALYAVIVEQDGTIKGPTVRVADSNYPNIPFSNIEVIADVTGGGFWVAYSVVAGYKTAHHYSASLSAVSTPIVAQGSDLIFGDIDGLRIASSVDSLIRRYDNNGNLTAETVYDPVVYAGDIRFSFTSAVPLQQGFNDGNGTTGSITSSTPAVFQEDITLTAPMVIGDPDGDADSPNYAYQWYKNGAQVSSATSSTYTVPRTGAGTYKVAITYTDYQEFRVSVDSADQVVTAANDGNGTIGPITSSTPGAFQEGVTLTAPIVASDPDGDSVTPNYAYQWYLNNAAIAGATSSSYAVGAQGFGNYSVAITYTDAQDFSATLTSAVQAVSPINNGQGNLSAITSSNLGVFQESVTLTAGAISGDPDGAATITAYQWYLNNAAIAGATSSSYAVGAQGFGNYSVAVTYTDAQVFSATLTSAAQEVSKNANSHLFSIVTQLEWDQNLD